jgi:ribosomal protein S18 acetylase RimI-like enzyme
MRLVADLEQAATERNGMSESPGSFTHALHPLDYPVWNALTTRQRAIAEGGALAWRYPAAIAPFAAMADTSAQSFAALRSLLPQSDRVALFTPDPVVPPAEFEVLIDRTAEQMVGAASEASADMPEIVVLGSDDVPAMMELVELTKPGPFNVRTHELGLFLGIRIGDQLVAMAGERMKLDGYTEITAVCTHPSHRGRGYAQALLSAVSRKILARGEAPFLHVFSDNKPAIALYRRSGLSIRRRIHVMVLGPRS